MKSEACFSNAISDFLAESYLLVKPPQRVHSVNFGISKACEEIFAGFIVPVVSLMRELMCH